VVEIENDTVEFLGIWFPVNVQYWHTTHCLATWPTNNQQPTNQRRHETVYRNVSEAHNNITDALAVCVFSVDVILNGFLSGCIRLVK